MAVVGTEGWAGKTSVILSSMLTHHRTNGLPFFFFYSLKTRDGKGIGWYVIYYCSFPMSISHRAPPHQRVRKEKKGGWKWLQSERAKRTRVKSKYKFHNHLGIAEPLCNPDVLG